MSRSAVRRNALHCAAMSRIALRYTGVAVSACFAMCHPHAGRCPVARYCVPTAMPLHTRVAMRCAAWCCNALRCCDMCDALCVLPFVARCSANCWNAPLQCTSSAALNDEVPRPTVRHLHMCCDVTVATGCALPLCAAVSRAAHIYISPGHKPQRGTPQCAALCCNVLRRAGI